MKDLINHFLATREQTETLCEKLQIEEYGIQGMEDVSPPRWHLAHTTWFFETFILKNHLKGYQVFDEGFHDLFNSYYQGLGQLYPRSRRGLLSRPLVHTVYAYRNHVNEKILRLFDHVSEKELESLKPLLILGLEHERQHQELLLMDIKYNFSLNPSFPVYAHGASVDLTDSFLSRGQADGRNEREQTRAYCEIEDVRPHGENEQSQWLEVPGGLTRIGYTGDAFCFDNELPSYETLVHPFALSSHLVTNENYLNFMHEEGYQRPTLWLSDGWDWVIKNKITAPLYWYWVDSTWWQFTLSGLKPLNLNEPVTHISFFEAEAFARWQGARLPTEEEWEYFVEYMKINASQGNFLEQGIYHPQAVQAGQYYGDVWEWTISPYSSYPGYQPFAGSVGEYNGKFMNNQRVLRGGCCVTPQQQIRKTYRNFFQPDKRWAFSGMRLAKDLK